MLAGVSFGQRVETFPDSYSLSALVLRGVPYSVRRSSLQFLLKAPVINWPQGMLDGSHTIFDNAMPKHGLLTVDSSPSLQKLCLRVACLVAGLGLIPHLLYEGFTPHTFDGFERR